MEIHTFHIMGSFLFMNASMITDEDGAITHTSGGLVSPVALIGPYEAWKSIYDIADKAVKEYSSKASNKFIISIEDYERTHRFMTEIVSESNLRLKKLVEDGVIEYSYDCNSANIFGPIKALIGAPGMQDFYIGPGMYKTSDGMVSVMPSIANLMHVNSYPI